MSYTYEYPRPALTVDCVVFLKDNTDLKVLLIERKYPPFEGKWAFPGGFVDMDETPENAASRELKEETGLSEIKLKQLHTFGAVDRDPRGRVVSVVFYGFTDINNSRVQAGDDAQKTQWFPVNKIPPLAIDHEEIFEMAKEKI